MSIRFDAARKLAAIILKDSIVQMPVTPEILDVTARTIMAYVSGDEQKQAQEALFDRLPVANPKGDCNGGIQKGESRTGSTQDGAVRPPR
jgi:hypothetical protein